MGAGLFLGILSMDFATTDLSDEHEAALRYLEGAWRDFGGKAAFHGPITTIATFEDNSKIREAVQNVGNGHVLVVDGGASRRCALFGGNLAQLAAQNGWAGILINGCVRDVDELVAEAVGIKALATHPRKSVKRGRGDVDVPLHFGGIHIAPGDYLYADRDGVIIAEKPLL